MTGTAVTILTEDKDRLSVLQHRLENTQGVSIVFSHVGFPSSPTDSVLRQLQDVRSEIVLIDVDPHSVERSIRAIELIRANTAEIAVFAVGQMTHPATIVSVMRAGAGEYLERESSSDILSEAFSRFVATRGRARSSAGRARVIAVANAKGGAGATSVAVNLASAIQEAEGQVLLVDFAPLGHAALQLNARPAFGLADALQNLHRLDSSLLDGLLTTSKSGLQLLAGSQQPYIVSPTAAELARLFDLLVSQFQYVIVDCSNRTDPTARLISDLANAVLLVAQTDVVSLWSAGKMRTFLEEGSGRELVRLVLNRYKKIPGFTDDDIEKATRCKVFWKLPNNFQSIAPAIDKGVPVVFEAAHDLSRSFRSLAAALIQAPLLPDGSLDFTSEPAKADAKRTSAGRLLVPSLRAGQ
jgi:pilus assembly protein CpaE